MPYMKWQSERVAAVVNYDTSSAHGRGLRISYGLGVPRLRISYGNASESPQTRAKRLTPIPRVFGGFRPYLLDFAKH